VVTSSREGGSSLNILSGLVAGNFSAYWLGISIVALMAIAYAFSLQGLSALMIAPAVFAFGLIAFGFLGMGPVTIAVDSYGPVTDNAQSVYELSVIEALPNIKDELKKEYGFVHDVERGKRHLQVDHGGGRGPRADALSGRPRGGRLAARGGPARRRVPSRSSFSPPRASPSPSTTCPASPRRSCSVS